MYFKDLSLQSLLSLGIVAALPQAPPPDPIPADGKFNLMGLRSASPIHFSTVNAARSSIFLQLSVSNATCEAESGTSSATFYLKDGGLFLYTAPHKKQQLYADRSGMGSYLLWLVTIRTCQPQ
jgi:hypothetical protein